ncbi:20989_t:CDS:2, partial [Gigaspora rosea]
QYSKLCWISIKRHSRVLAKVNFKSLAITGKDPTSTIGPKSSR